MTEFVLKQKMKGEDPNELVDLLFPFAQGLLVKYDSFPPFGATVDNEYQITICLETSEELPPSHQILELMTGQMRREAAEKKIQFAAICMDVQLGTATEGERIPAIYARLESREQAIEVFLPYQKIGDEHQYGNAFAREATSRELFL